MAEQRHENVDALTGTATTGHEWDGVRELNTPLPRWWLWVFYATIIWSIGYWIVYPSWPLISGYTTGVFGWHSRDAVVNDLAGLRAIRGPMVDKLAAASLQEIRDDDRSCAHSRARRPSRSFSENCAALPRHRRRRRQGLSQSQRRRMAVGRQARRHRRHHPPWRPLGRSPRPALGGMPAFGRDGMMKRADIETVADYVRSIAGLPVDPKADLAAGKKIFADTCASCHGADGKGNRELGAPNLTDAIWLYGSDKAAIVDGLWNGRGGVMPAWDGRLDDSTIKALAVYVHTLGGGEK